MRTREEIEAETPDEHGSSGTWHGPDKVLDLRMLEVLLDLRDLNAKIVRQNEAILEKLEEVRMEIPLPPFEVEPKKSEDERIGLDFVTNPYKV